MRPVSIADIETAARVLVRVPQNCRHDLMVDLLRRADLADRYRKRFGRRHPDFGSGTLMSAAQNFATAGRSDRMSTEMLHAFSCVINALSHRTTHQKS